MLKTMESEAQKIIRSNKKKMQEMMEKAIEMEKYNLPTRIIKLETGMMDFKEKTIALLEEIKSNKRLTLDDKEELYKLARERLNLTVEVDRKIISWINQLGEEKLPNKALNSELSMHLNIEINHIGKLMKGIDHFPEMLERESAIELLKEFKKMNNIKRFD